MKLWFLKNRVMQLFLLCLIAWLPYFLLRPDIVGFDSYAYLTGLCQTTNFFWFDSAHIASFFALSWLPCNFLAIKIVLFTCFVSFVAGLAFLAYQINKKYWFWSVLVTIGLSPVALFTFTTLENDQIALPFIAWGFALLFLTQKKFKLLSIPLFVIAGLLWNGTALLVLSLTPTFLFLSPLSLTIIYTQWHKIVYLFVRLNVSENMVYNFALFGVLPIFFLFVFKNKRIGLSTIILLVFCFFNTQFIILLLPFVLIGVCHAFEMLEAKKAWQQINLLKILSIICLLGFGFMVLVQSPTQSDWLAVNKSIELAKDNNVPLYNDWETGYWVLFNGWDTDSFGGGKNPDYFDLDRPFVGLTKKHLDCSVVFEESYNVYLCE